MKKLRFVVILLALTAVFSTAFAQDATSLTVAFDQAQPNTLDPAAAGIADEFLVLRNVCEGLVSYDPKTLAPTPALASSWDISSDGLTYTFHLRDGVTFSDGSKFDATAVKYTFDRLANPTTGTSYTAGLVLGSVAGWADARPSAPKVGEGTPTVPAPAPSNGISGVKVVDPSTVTVTLTAPKPSFLETLTLPGAFIVANGETDFSKGPTCTGPYTVSEWTPDQQIVLKSNDSYWAGAPAVKTVTIKVIPEQSEQEVEYEAGGLDMVTVPPSDVSRVQGDATLSKQLVQVSNLTTVLLRLNLKDPVISNVKVRQALAAAIDRETIVSTVLQGQGAPAYGLYPPSMSAYDPNFKPFKYDPAAIKQSLADAGYPNGVTITIRTDQVEATNNVLNAIQQTAAPAGITIKVDSTEASVYTQDRNSCNMQAGSIIWGFDYPDPENVATQALAGTSASRIACGYNTLSDADALVALNNKAASTPLGADRDKLWQQFDQEAVGTDAAVIPIYFPTTSALVNPRVGGTPYDAQGNIQFYLIKLSS